MSLKSKVLTLFFLLLLIPCSSSAFELLFDPKIDYGVGTQPWSVFCADLDEDTDLDLAVANHNSDNVSILLNLTISRPNSYSLLSPQNADSVKTLVTFIWQT